MEKAFAWGRQINSSQPITADVWSRKLPEFNLFQLANSDVITYHNYRDEKDHLTEIDTLKNYGRPLICTEYMASKYNSTFFNIMPILKPENIGTINCGLVTGKTNTMYAWSTPMPDGFEPLVWIHDIFRPNGTPFSKEEISFIVAFTRR